MRVWVLRRRKLKNSLRFSFLLLVTHWFASDYKSGTVISHGFTDEKVIQNFPLRGKPVYLHVRRRRWYGKATGKTFSC